MLRAEKFNHLCQYFFFGQMATSTVIIISADLILVLRVWILFGRSEKLLYFMVPLIAAEMIAMIAIGFYTINSLEQYLHIGPILGGCYSLKVPRFLTFYAIPPFVTAVVMFSMTIHKCGAALSALGPGRTPVITLFLRDGVFWFLALVLVSVVEIVLWNKARPSLAQIPVVPATGLIAVIGARVVLNIKHVTSAPDIDPDAVTYPTQAEVNHNVEPGRRTQMERVPWYLKTTDTVTGGANTLLYNKNTSVSDSYYAM
ncbi:hypothetical protein B0H11DRAFT_1971669 [Mycena galericulata]|nr:hypothetical protein B0H11DRAFT_1971669 [Mycena galericulata]